MTKNIIIISPDSQSSVTLGFTQVLTGTCHLLSPLTSPAEGQLGYNQEQSTDTHTHTRGEQRVKKKKTHRCQSPRPPGPHTSQCGD